MTQRMLRLGIAMLVLGWALASSGRAWSQDQPSAPAAAAATQPADEEPDADAAPAEETATPVVPAIPSDKIEATVEQLEELIAAPASARLGREVDEPEQQTALFGDPDRVRRLLGDEPRYVYIPAGDDPMIVPWVRERVMAAELVAEAEQLLQEGKHKDALARVNQVLERFPRAEGAKQAVLLKGRITRLLEGSSVSGSSQEAPIQMPPPDIPQWVQQNTRGVLYNTEKPQESFALIGDYVLARGETIPNYPGIQVDRFEKGAVILKYQGQEYKLLVEGE